METLQPFFTYIAIGLGVILGIILISWLTFAIYFFRRTQGITNYITDFFSKIIEDEFNQAYAMTTTSFQQQNSLQKFRKFIKTNQLKQYKRTSFAMPKIEGDQYSTEITVILNSGKEIPLKISLIQENKKWKIDLLQKA